MTDIHAFQDRGDTARQAQGIDGTAGDAQDIRHRFIRDDETGGCLLCGLAEPYRKHTKTARERLLRALTDDELCMCGGPACPAPEALADAYAHQLAEQIRASRDETRGAVQATKVMDFAADLIDPEKQR
jgi:hypothetical protein